MIELKASDFIGKSKEELGALHGKYAEIFRDTQEMVSLAETVPGKKLAKRLESDVSAIRAKYCNISGTDFEQLSELHRLQGRETQAAQELSNLVDAKKIADQVAKNIEEIEKTLHLLQKPNPLSR